MKGTHIAAITTFLLTFALSILLVGLPKPEATTKLHKISEAPLRQQISETPLHGQILRFLEQDRQNGRDMEKDLAEAHGKESNSAVSEAKIIDQLLAKMQKMSAADFPVDFQKAWQDHIEAWRERAALLKQTSIKNKSATTDQEFNQKYGRQHKDITGTYNELLKVARKYGVSFSYYAN